MGDSLEGSEATPESQNVAIVDITAFTNYILKAATVLLPEDDSQAEPVTLKATLDDPNNQESIRKFLSDPQVSTLFIQRSTSKGKPIRDFVTPAITNLTLTSCKQMMIPINHLKVKRKRNRSPITSATWCIIQARKCPAWYALNEVRLSKPIKVFDPKCDWWISVKGLHTKLCILISVKLSHRISSLMWRSLEELTGRLPIFLQTSSGYGVELLFNRLS